MERFVRSCLAAGVAVIMAVAITILPSSPEPSPQPPTASAVRVVASPVQLSAAAEPLAVSGLPNLLADWLYRIIVPPSASAPFPEPQFEPVVVGNSIGSGIKNIYNAIEPWVQYGFELATYAVGWVPYVGWLSGQIMIFYHFGERIARSITFNIADWLDGNVSFLEGLINVGVDTVNSFIQLGIDQWNFWLPPLPPLPPLPLSEPLEGAELVMAASTEESTTDVVDAETEGTQRIQPVEGTEEQGQGNQELNEKEELIEEDAVKEDVVEKEDAVVKEDFVQEARLAEVPETVVDTEQSQAQKTTVEAKPTKDSKGTVSAQGEVRTPGIDASKDDVRTENEPQNGSGDNKLNNTPEETPAPQTPSVNDDGLSNNSDTTTNAEAEGGDPPE